MVKADEQTYEEALAILAGLASLASAAAPAPATASARLEVDRDQSRLHIAEARYRALVEQIPAVTFIASLVGGISEIYVSPQIEQLLGFTQEEWVADPVLWFRQLHPEDRPLLTREFAEACATGRPLRGICRAYARDGHMVWVHGEARFVRDEQGRPLFLQGIAFDVTEQQRALETRALLQEEQIRRAEADRERARLERIFASLPAAITIARGPRHLVEYMNALARRFAGANAEAAVGKPLADGLPAYAELAEVFDAVYRTGSPIEAKEWETTTTAGQTFFHYVAQPLFDDTGAVTGVLAHMVDVSVQVNARKERERLVEELQRTVRYNEMFAGMLGHDLRNPLGSIMSGAQLALRRAAGEQLQRPLSRILSACERMSRMIEQLLDFTRIRVGRGLELDSEETDLAVLSRRAIDELEDANPGWQFELSIAGDPIGRWDDDRLLQVVSNLVSNGVKHGDAAAPLCISIDGSRPEAVTLAVHNVGAIPRELMDSLFDPFRGSRHRRDRQRGLGLGLFITKEIVRAHGGTIEVRSDETGTLFTVTLPRLAIAQGRTQTLELSQ